MSGDGIGAVLDQLHDEIAPESIPDDAYVAPPSRRLELVIASASVALSALVVYLASHIAVRHETGGVDPRWWPTVLGSVALTLSLLLLVVAIVRPPFDREDVTSATRRGWIRCVAAMALSCVFIALWSTLSFSFTVGLPGLRLTFTAFIVVLPLYVAGLVAMFGGRGLKALVVFPAIVSVVIYVLFHLLLKVPL